MKKATKTLLLMLCAVVLVVSSILGTVAYLTSTASVENTFTVGKVKITMDEANVDEYGVAVTPATRDTSNAYKLVSGHEYTKDPIIHIEAGSEPCWLFVKVENGIATYETDEDGKTIADQLDANGWKELTGVENVYYHAVEDARLGAKDVNVFGSFTIADNADTVATWKDVTSENTKITVTAYAVQADGFVDAGGKTAVQLAWEAVSTANP